MCDQIVYRKTDLLSEETEEEPRTEQTPPLFHCNFLALLPRPMIFLFIFGICLVFGIF